MRTVPLIAVCACASAIVGFAGNAFAIGEGDPAQTPPAPPAATPPAQPPAAYPAPPPPAPGENPEGAKPKSDFKSFTLTANPLSIIVGRYSINFEYLPAPHHGIIVVPSIWMLSASSGSGASAVESSFKYYGGELGYHFYTADNGAGGFFVGPSFVYMNMNVKDKSTFNGATTEASASSSLYGVAIDLGGQWVAKGGFTIGGGFGIMYVKVASKVDNTPTPSINVSGTLPRFLFTIGYSF